MANVVEILVVAKNLTKPAFDAASKDAAGLGGVMGKMGAISTAALVGIGVESVRMASTFQAEMTKLSTQAGVSKDKLAGLSKGVLDLAGQVGLNPDSLAESLFHVESNMASMGISSAKALEMVKVAAEGAQVGGADLVDVTNALTAAVASGIPGVQNMSQAMGVLNATVGAGDMTMQDLSKAFGTGMVAVVKGYGLSIRDVGAALATFGDNNIRGAQAGTALRVAVQSLAVPAASAKDKLKEFGMTTDTLAKDMQTGGLLKALEDLKSRMVKAGVSSQEQGQVITDMFGKKAGTGVNILLGQLDRVKSKYPDLEKGAGKFGDAWAQTQKTTKVELEKVKGQFDKLMIQLGDKLLPVLDKVLGYFNKHHDALLGIAVVLGGLLVTFATLSAVLKAYAVIQGIVKLATEAWTATQIALDIAMDANPIGLVIIAVGLLATGFLYLWTHFSGFRDFFIGAWKDIRKAFAVVVSVILSYFGDMLHAAAMAFGWIPGIGPKLKSADAEFKKFRDSVNNTLAGIHDKTVRVTIDQHTYTATSPGTFYHGLAHGGVVGAAGGGPRSNMTLVGENGPELVDLAPGSTVHSNADSQRLMAGGGSGGEVRVVFDFLGADQEFMKFFKKAVRVYGGGDVQTAFGRN